MITTSDTSAGDTSAGDTGRALEGSASTARVAAPPAPAVSAEDALRAAKPPVGTGASPLFAQLIALAFIGLGVVGVQALLVSWGVVTGPAWISSTVEAGDGIAGDSVLVLLTGIVAVVLGLLLLPVVFRRRPRKGLALSAQTGVHLRPRDLAEVLESRLEGTDTLTDVRVKATRRRVRITADSVASKGQNSQVQDDIEARVGPALDALERKPRLAVAIRNDGI
ncbi:DUF6286 domain-containing protein [Nocardioides hwasunensis]|uniref:DUF6286 domain-containing protein n=1 Tax=Nocardioides hwasunensis TaxID=397258 RepID=A0ABR8MCM9_9ACTN|nr:DUF6286 domain-containing protein [Nocardioides hwasunensis]MBD3912991.1 hypothetical protein [Nocardioides hwasunensis]